MIMFQIVIVLIAVCVIENHDCATTQTPKIVPNEFVPLIIGISLLIFVIVVLAMTLILCFCIKFTNRETKGNYNVIKKTEEYQPQIKLVEYSPRLSNDCINKRDAPLPKIQSNELPVSVEDISKLARSSLQFTKMTRNRRASVPGSLSILQEASPSLEASSRKMSLSYNCVLEPVLDSKKNSIKQFVDEEEQEEEVLRDSRVSQIKMYTRKDIGEKSTGHKKNPYAIFDEESQLSDDCYSKFGKIIFSLQYNVDEKTLEVTLKRAKYLSGYRIKGKNRFYVKLRIRKPDLRESISMTSLSGIPEKKIKKGTKNVKGTFRSSIRSDFCNPNFEENFKFINVTATILKDGVLQFIIKEETPKFLEKNRVIGQVNFILDDAQLIDKHEFISEIVRDILPAELIASKGQAVLSLHYNTPLAVLSVSIREVIPSEEPLTDVSAELWLRSIDSVITSKKLPFGANLTSSEVMEFNIDYCLLNSICMIIQFFSRVRNCPLTPYGRIVLGPIRFSDGPCLMHWVEMSVGNTMVIRNHEII